MVENESVDELLEQLDDLDNPNLANRFRKALKAQAAKITEQSETIAGYQRAEKVGVLKDAGVAEAAYDRFLRDWSAEHGDDEFTVDTVKEAAAAMGYALTVPDATTSTAPNFDEAEQARRAEQDRQRELINAGVVEPGLPPDQAQRVAEAEAGITPGNQAAIRASMAEKRKQLIKATQ